MQRATEPQPVDAEKSQVWDEDRALTRTVAALSEPAFAEIWSNPEDDVYDA